MYEHLFLGKPDVGHFDFSFFGLKQQSKGKSIIEKQSIPGKIIKRKILYGLEIKRHELTNDPNTM